MVVVFQVTMVTMRMAEMPQEEGWVEAAVSPFQPPHVMGTATMGTAVARKWMVAHV